MIRLRMARLKALMLARGVSTVQLADAAEVGRPNLCMLLNGHHRPSSTVAGLVADAIGWDGDPMELFEEIELEEVGA